MKSILKEGIMKRSCLSLMLFSALCMAAASCGGDGNGSEDTTTEDTAPDDQADPHVDNPPDQPVDQPVDGPVDPSGDDGAPDTLPDEIEDAEPDAEDTVEEPDGPTECEASGGTCTTYAVVADPCVTCETDGLMPAPPDDPARGCTSSGVGASPWCCVHVVPTTEPSDCETDGGECYPPSDSDPCPVGWDAVYTACREGTVCCMPGESCG
jgi:hypothetical protein